MSIDSTRRSWNAATKIHNSHKGDQTALFKRGQDPLFPEELALLGDLKGKRLVHLQCNSGQDTLGLARRGAHALGVDFSDEAIRFARALSAQTGIEARFEEAELLTWLASTQERFEIAFSSYGAAGWIEDLEAWAEGIARVLLPGGRFVYVEFHPLLWSIDQDGALRGDDYFCQTPFIEPVSDYVGESGVSEHVLGGSAPAVASEQNTIPATSYQHTMASIITALVRAKLRLCVLKEWPYSNGCKRPGLVLGQGHRWHPPEHWASVPLMFGLVVERA